MTPIKMENELGAIVLAADCLSRMAGYVATGCYGVVGMAYRGASDGIASLLKWDALTKGVRVYAEEDKVCVELHVIIEYGVNIRVISNSIINSVKYAVENLTRFKVGKIKVCVEGVRVE
jgi:uncharacterized alkaline shock family protein YloU